MTAPPNSRPRATVTVGLLAVLLLTAACGADTQQGSQDSVGALAPPEGYPLPNWLEQVHPDPGAEASPTPQVQVVHGAVGVFEGVRLLVDGTDVTQYAEPGQGVLAYDPNRPRSPVELGPGTHEATALRVKLDNYGRQHEILDQYEWQFTVQ